MNRPFHNQLVLSFLLVAVLFAIVLLFGKPILNSDDDFYLLYTMAGGYGNKPTHLLHYLYGWNPFLYWPVAKLMALYPGFNWYSAFLLFLQFLACWQIARLFFFFFQTKKALAFFLLFFLFINCPLLLSLNNTNTSAALGMAGCLSFFCQFLLVEKKGKIFSKQFLLPSLLLVVSGLLRVHSVGLCGVLTIVAALTFFSWRRIKKLLIFFAFIAGIIASLSLLQYWYYTETISNYKAEEAYRNALFKTINLPQAPLVSDTGIAETKNSFIRSLFLGDTSFVKTADLEEYLKTNSRPRTKWASNVSNSLYWMFINQRVYLLFIACVGLLLLALKEFKTFRRWLLVAAVFALLYLFLYLFFKITFWIILVFVFFLYAPAVFQLKGAGFQRSGLLRMGFALLLLNAGWMLIRLNKTAEKNRSAIVATHALLTEIKAHPACLFVHASTFNDNGFSVWDTPEQYPLHNFLNFGNLLTNTAGPALQRFGVKNVMESLPLSDSLFLSGLELPNLNAYYKQVYNREVELQKVPGFTNLVVYKVRFR